MQNAVIYARYSSRGQNEQTIEGQVRVCKEYAKQLKYNVVKVYADKHKTGTDVNRPEFQKMITDAKKRKFDYVIVYMLDRFARNRYYSTMYNWELMQNGVKVISATENISESEEGEFYQMFLEWNAERYSKRLSKRVKEGITTSVANGTSTGGIMIYGYKVENKKVIVNKDQAEVVKYVFENYAKGISKQEIAKKLNIKGLRYNGKLFSARNFDRMLSNLKYTGKFELAGRLCENTYPRIIDDKTFKTVQDRLRINKHNAGANCAKQEYLLQGKVFCGLCGSVITADGGTSSTGKQYHYYACTGKKKKHNCTKKNEKKEYLEWYVVDETIKYLSNKKRVEIIANDIVEYYNDKINNKQIKRVKQEIARVEKEIDNAVNAMVSTSNTSTHKKLDVKINELTILSQDLNNQLVELEFEQSLQIRAKDIIDFVAEFTNGNPEEFDFQKRIIDNLVNSVYVYDDKTVIYYSLNINDNNIISKDETDSVLNGLDAKVQTLTHQVNQYRQCLNSVNCKYIFVNGIPGIVIKK